MLATLTDALASTVLSLGRGYIIGDTHATPDEFAWLDIGYTVMKLIGFLAASSLIQRRRSAPPDHRIDAGDGRCVRHDSVHGPARPAHCAAHRQGFSGGILLVAGQDDDFPRLSAKPAADPASPVCDGIRRRSGDDRTGPAGLVDRQPVLDVDFLQYGSGGVGGGRPAVDR